MAAFGVFASDTDSLKVIKTKPYTPWAVERYFNDTTLTEPLLALKTNLLFDALATPNIEVEVPLNNRLSIMAEYWCPWWLDKYTGDCYQFMYGGLEGRYWFRKSPDREVLTGHFLGLYAGFGLYDVGRYEGGYQGELDYHAGLTYGYSFRLNRFLRLETSIGLGAMRTKYNHYIGTENVNAVLWQYSGRYMYFGPSKLKVSLVVLLHGRDYNK